MRECYGAQSALDGRDSVTSDLVIDEGCDGSRSGGKPVRSMMAAPIHKNPEVGGIASNGADRVRTFTCLKDFFEVPKVCTR
jgi:hypothetical protein